MPRCGAALLALALSCALALSARADAAFDSLDGACEYLRASTVQRDEAICLTLTEGAARGLDDAGLRAEFIMAAPMLSRLYSTHTRSDGYIVCRISPVYRAGVRMVDAWRSGDLSALSEDERRALELALELASELGARCASPLELEKAIFDELCARISYSNDAAPSIERDDPLATATCALLRGEANCQGYSDAFYLLASLSGLEAGYQSGYDAQDMPHMWNTLRISDSWYAVDVTAGDSWGGGEPLVNYALFNAGLDACAGCLSWPEHYQTAPIAPVSDENYFFNAGAPEFGASFDSLDALCRHICDRRAEYGDAYAYALLKGRSALDMGELDAAMARALESSPGQLRAGSWRACYWPRGEAICLMLRWT